MTYTRTSKGATVTIFAPYDCANNCPFCINKKDYKNNNGFDLGKVLIAIKTMHEITPECDFVITGGEPFADLEKLGLILDTIKMCGENHKVFINTTLPTNRYKWWDLLHFVIEYKDTITGLNVSRHLERFVGECSDDIFDLLPVPVRINCVLYAERVKGAVGLLSRFAKCSSVKSFQFREDYRYATLENLYPVEDNILLKRLLGELSTYYSDFNITSKERFRWRYDIMRNKITYHKTLPYSKIELEDGSYFIGDIIVTPKGEILDDWNDYGVPLNLEAYKNAIIE